MIFARVDHNGYEVVEQAVLKINATVARIEQTYAPVPISSLLLTEKDAEAYRKASRCAAFSSRLNKGMPTHSPTPPQALRNRSGTVCKPLLSSSLRWGDHRVWSRLGSKFRTVFEPFWNRFCSGTAWEPFGNRSGTAREPFLEPFWRSQGFEALAWDTFDGPCQHVCCSSLERGSV